MKINISWKPNRKSDESIQSQLFRFFVNRISSGDWPVGMGLPSERKLADIFEVNRSTVTSVLNDLKAEGVIESKGSAGTFIANNTWSLLVSNPPPNWNQYIKHGMHMPNQKIIQDINKFEFQSDIIRLGTGELSPELFPVDMMREVMHKVSLDMKSLSYEEPLGSYDLRCAISSYLSKYSMNLKPENILIVTGSLQALHLISIGLLQHGSSIYVESPSYLKSLQLFESSGMYLKGVKMDSEGIIVSDLENKIRKTGTNLLYTIPTFHNPTGALMSLKRREELMSLINEYRLPVIEDDAYRELWLEEEPPLPLKSLDYSGNVLYAGTLSKAFSPGIRIGWLAGSQAVVERLGDIKMQTDYGSSSISQNIAYEWITGGYYDSYSNQLKKILIRKRNFTLGLLDKYFYDIAQWSIPKGGFYIWLVLKNKINLSQLFDFALKEKLLINPGHIYDFKDNKGIRISYSYASEEQLSYGIKKLAEIILKLAG